MGENNGPLLSFRKGVSFFNLVIWRWEEGTENTAAAILQRDTHTGIIPLGI